jgi:hypothetical protein
LGGDCSAKQEQQQQQKHWHLSARAKKTPKKRGDKHFALLIILKGDFVRDLSFQVSLTCPWAPAPSLFEKKRRRRKDLAAAPRSKRSDNVVLRGSSKWRRSAST